MNNNSSQGSMGVVHARAYRAFIKYTLNSELKVTFKTAALKEAQSKKGERQVNKGEHQIWEHSTQQQ